MTSLCVNNSGEDFTPHLLLPLSMGCENYGPVDVQEDLSLLQSSTSTVRHRRSMSPPDVCHTNLRFTRPSDHPLEQRHTSSKSLVAARSRVRPFCIPIVTTTNCSSSDNNDNDDDSSVVSELSVGGWDQHDDFDNEEDALFTNSECQQASSSLPANSWTIQVNETKYENSETTPWFKAMKKGSKGYYMLEGQEVVSLLERQHQSVCVCVHRIAHDNRCAILSPAQARDFFIHLLKDARSKQLPTTDLAQHVLAILSTPQKVATHHKRCSSQEWSLTYVTATR
jgi:hypothetical protein